MFASKGVGRPISHLTEAVAFDLIHKVKTETRKTLGEYPSNLSKRTDIVPYQPSYSSTVKTALKFLQKSKSVNLSDFSFTDLGCGKGKVLILASNYAISEIKGVELDPELISICKSNLKTIKGQNIKVYLRDVNSFDEFREREIIYCFNSFGGETLKSVLEKLEQKKEVYFIFCNPKHTMAFKNWNLIFSNDEQIPFKRLKIFHHILERC